MDTGGANMAPFLYCGVIESVSNGGPVRNLFGGVVETENRG
jgi:hypothetical protein